jgi:hypothetical protein
LFFVKERREDEKIRNCLSAQKKWNKKCWFGGKVPSLDYFSDQVSAAAVCIDGSLYQFAEDIWTLFL